MPQQSCWTVGVGHVLYPRSKGLSWKIGDAYPLRPEDNRMVFFQRMRLMQFFKRFNAF
jgi:hypothetical protein